MHFASEFRGKGKVNRLPSGLHCGDGIDPNPNELQEVNDFTILTIL